MKAFGFESAKDLAHAVALLAEHGAAVKILAGGTDLLADLKFSGHAPDVVIDISRRTISRTSPSPTTGCTSARWSRTPRSCARR